MQKPEILFLTFSSFLHFCTVFVNVHILVCMAEQITHGTAGKFCGQSVTGGIADRQFWMLPGIFRGQTRIRLQESVENWDNSVIVRFRSREVWKSALPGSVWAAETA